MSATGPKPRRGGGSNSFEQFRTKKVTKAPAAGTTLSFTTAVDAALLDPAPYETDAAERAERPAEQLPAPAQLPVQAAPAPVQSQPERVEEPVRPQAAAPSGPLAQAPVQVRETHDQTPAAQPAPVVPPAAPAPAAEPDPVAQEAKKPKPKKAPTTTKKSFFEPIELGKRMRRTYNATRHAEGHASLSEFIYSLVELECQRLEDLYNDGKPFEGNPDAIPKGRPVRDE